VESIRRGFVDIAAGQVHYRTAGAGGARPLVMFHPSPGSAKMLEPLILGFAQNRRVIALDTLGNGDSAPPPGDRPGLQVFVAAHLQAMDALGLVEVDLYGSHTGGNIACEVAIERSRQVRHLILDGMSLYSKEERADMLANYAPAVSLRDDGTHLAYLWNFVRDTFLFWPWYKRDAAHVRTVGLPPLATLHEKVVEVIKAATTFHHSYNAAIAYEKEARLPLVTVPTLLACARTDMLLPYLDAVAALLPHAQRAIFERAGAAEAIDMMSAFLDAEAEA
jgi:pimeloyl-ACP methyl ester carboxylesterase